MLPRCCNYLNSWNDSRFSSLALRSVNTYFAVLVLYTWSPVLLLVRCTRVMSSLILLSRVRDSRLTASLLPKFQFLVSNRPRTVKDSLVKRCCCLTTFIASARRRSSFRYALTIKFHIMSRIFLKRPVSQNVLSLIFIPQNLLSSISMNYRSNIFISWYCNISLQELLPFILNVNILLYLLVYWETWIQCKICITILSTMMQVTLNLNPFTV